MIIYAPAALHTVNGLFTNSNYHREYSKKGKKYFNFAGYSLFREGGCFIYIFTKPKKNN